MLHSENSVAAYASDWRDFCRWLTSYYGEAYPLEATPVDIVDYIRAMSKRGLAARTVERHLTAITYFFSSASLDSPAAAAWPRQVLRAYKAKAGTCPRKKTALTYKDVCIICAAMGQEKADIRDRAIILLGWSLAARRSELASLQAEDVTFTRAGLEVLLRRSKGDQLGAGTLLAVPRLSPCDPCAALGDWFLISGISHGFIFGGLHPRTINGIIKRRARAAGYRSDISAHSLRRGYCTDIARAGYSLTDVMSATRHKSTRVLSEYVEPLTRYKLKPLL